MFFNKMRKQVKIIVIIVSIAFLGGALFAGGTSFFGGGEQQVAQATVVTVNGQSVSFQQFQQEFINQVQQLERQHGPISGGMYEAVKYHTLNSIIADVIVNQEISRRNISVSSSKVNENLTDLKNNFADEEMFEQQLQMAGITENQLKDILERELRTEKFFEEVTGDISISEEEIIEAYEEVEVSHILIRPKGENEEAWELAKEMGEKVLADINDYEFAELAEWYSEDYGTAEEDGGSLGYISRGDTVEEFEETAFSLEVGEVSDLVRTTYGYHIIKVTDKKVAEGEEFEAARERINSQLKDEKQDRLISEWYEQTREDADVVIEDYQLAAYEQALEGNYDEAIEYYKQAIEERSEDGYLYSSLAEVYLEKDDVDSAIEQYKEAIERITNDPELFYALGEAYAELDLQEEATENYLKASELAVNDIEMQVVVLNSLNAVGSYDETEIIQTRIEEIEARQAELGQQQEQQPQDLNLEDVLDVESLDESVDESDDNE